MDDAIAHDAAAIDPVRADQQLAAGFGRPSRGRGAATAPALGAGDDRRLDEYRRDPRRAITEDGVVCLVCGACFRHLTNTHLRRHGLTSDQYKRRFGYNM